MGIEVREHGTMQVPGDDISREKSVVSRWRHPRDSRKYTVIALERLEWHKVG